MRAGNLKIRATSPPHLQCHWAEKSVRLENNSNLWEDVVILYTLTIQPRSYGRPSPVQVVLKNREIQAHEDFQFVHGCNEQGPDYNRPYLYPMKLAVHTLTKYLWLHKMVMLSYNGFIKWCVLP